DRDRNRNPRPPAGRLAGSLTDLRRGHRNTERDLRDRGAELGGVGCSPPRRPPTRRGSRGRGRWLDRPRACFEARVLSRRRGGQRLRRGVGARAGRRSRAPRTRDRERGSRRDLDARDRRLPRERDEHGAAQALRLPRGRHSRADLATGRCLERRGATGEEEPMIKVEAGGIRERGETVIDAGEDETGHGGVTVVQAIGHGRERGVTHEYRGRVFESRFLPKALLTFIVDDEIANAVVEAVTDSARSGNESGDGLVWSSRVDNVTHHRTGRALDAVEAP